MRSRGESFTGVSRYRDRDCRRVQRYGGSDRWERRGDDIERRVRRVREEEFEVQSSGGDDDVRGEEYRVEFTRAD